MLAPAKDRVKLASMAPQQDPKNTGKSSKKAASFLTNVMSLAALGVAIYKMADPPKESVNPLEDEVFRLANELLDDEELGDFMADYLEGMTQDELVEKYELQEDEPEGLGLTAIPTFDWSGMDVDLDDLEYPGSWDLDDMLSAMAGLDELPPEPAPTPYNVAYTPYTICTDIAAGQYTFTVQAAGGSRRAPFILWENDGNPYFTYDGRDLAYSNEADWDLFFNQVHGWVEGLWPVLPNVDEVFDALIGKLQDLADDIVSASAGASSSITSPTPESSIPKPVKTKPINLLKTLPNYQDYLVNPTFQNPIIPKTNKLGNIYTRIK